MFPCRGEGSSSRPLQHLAVVGTILQNEWGDDKKPIRLSLRLECDGLALFLGYLLKDSFYSLWAVECRPVEACAVLWSAKKRNPQVFLICSVNLKTPVLHNNWYFAFWMDRNWRSICHKTSMTKDVVNIFHVWERRSKLMARVNFKC